MPRGEHGIQDPDIVKAMDAGDMQTAKSLADKKLTTLAITPLLWIGGGLLAIYLFLKIRK